MPSILLIDRFSLSVLGKSCSRSSRRFFTCLLLALTVSACSGDSGSSASDPPNGQSSFSGTIFAGRVSTRSVGEVFAIDLETRVARQYVVMETDATESLYGGSVTFRDPTHIGSGELLMGANDCLRDFSSVDNDFCVDRVDSDNNIERVISSRFGRLETSPSMSPDQSLVAAVITTDAITGPIGFQLYTSDDVFLDEVIWGQRVIDADFSNIVWTADNRMIFGVRLRDRSTGLVITEPNSLAISVDRTLNAFRVDSNGTSTIDNISLSPDGRLLAYDVNPDTFETDRVRSSFVVDIETGETTPIAVDGSGDVWAPAWSPDGQYLLLNHGLAPGIFGISGVLPFQSLIRWQGMPVEFTVNFDDDGNAIEDGQLFVVDTREALDLSFINRRWLFNERKVWVP